jgi:hypothetical protein
MADEMLITMPFGLAILFLLLAAGTWWVRLRIRKRMLNADTLKGPLRDAAVFSFGAVLLGGFFLFDAVFSYLMG